MPKHDAPKPWKYPVKIPDVMIHMKPAVGKIMQQCIHLTSQCEPQRAQVARLFSRITQGRTDKLSKRWLNEKRAALSFSLNKATTIPPHTAKMLDRGGQAEAINSFVV